jgi:hypothetical protein
MTNKKSAFAFLDREFSIFPTNLLDDLGWFCLTTISETLLNFTNVWEQDLADEWAYEWATQPKYKKYLEPLGL